MGDTAELVLFWVFAIPLMASAAGVVAARSPIHAVMSLISAFFWLAGIYVLLTAHLLAFVQIIVYAGAIMVLFLFVVMLLSLTDAELGLEKMTALKVVGVVATAGLLDLDDVRAEGRQHERAEGQRDGLLERDDPDAGEGVPHHVFGVGKMSRLGACSRFQTITERRYLITRSPCWL